MLDVIYAGVSFILIVTNKPFLLSVIKLSVVAPDEVGLKDGNILGHFLLQQFLTFCPKFRNMICCSDFETSKVVGLLNRDLM